MSPLRKYIVRAQVQHPLDNMLDTIIILALLGVLVCLFRIVCS